MKKIEKIAAAYCLLTTALMAIFELSGLHLLQPGQMLLMRLAWLGVTITLIGLARLRPPKAPRWGAIKVLKKTQSSPTGGPQGAAPILTFLRTAAQLGWTYFWYPDTYEFNRLLPNLDHLFAAAEQHLFGCQPALEFSAALPQMLWSELFNLGYWSYFPMMAVLVVSAFFKGKGERAATLILTAFFFYYTIYIFLPVAGPQYYFQAVGTEEILAGHFPSIGNWFSHHTEMLTAPGDPDGFFYRLVTSSQAAGERPTAAFPSSHIGISTIVLILAWRYTRKLLPLLIPFWLLLCGATVYIQAHYVIDAIAGLLSAPLFLWAAGRIVKRENRLTFNA